MKPLACPRCQSADIYRRFRAGSAYILACFGCGRFWKSASAQAVKLPTTAERRARQVQAEAAQAAERSRYGE